MKPNDKQHSQESPLDRIEKAFFSDIGFEEEETIIETPATVKIKKTKIPTAPPIQTQKVHAKKTRNPLTSIPAIIVYSVCVMILGIVLMNNHIYIIPHERLLKNSSLIPTETWTVTPASTKTNNASQRLIITLEALSSCSLTIVCSEPVNVDSLYVNIPVRASDQSLVARLYVRDSNLVSNKFSPILLPIVNLNSNTPLAPLPLSSQLNNTGIQKQKITDFKIEFYNPTAKEVTIIIDKKVQLIKAQQIARDRYTDRSNE